jgi:hypothetical protein
LDETCTWWAGDVLPGTPIALAVFTVQPTQEPGGNVTNALGVAAAGDRVVIVGSEQLAPFLLAHAQRTLVCWDAAAVHWTLHAFLQPRTAAAPSRRYGSSRNKRG